MDIVCKVEDSGWARSQLLSKLLLEHLLGMNLIKMNLGKNKLKTPQANYVCWAQSNEWLHSIVPLAVIRITVPAVLWLACFVATSCAFTEQTVYNLEANFIIFALDHMKLILAWT